MEPLGPLIQKAQWKLRKHHSDGGIEQRSAHGCYGGWIYEPQEGAHDLGRRCPDCVAEVETRRVGEELQSTGVGERYWGTMWDALEMLDPFPALKRAADNIGSILAAGDHLILSGPPGCGKTQAAVLLIRAALGAHRSARLVNVGEAAMEIRSAFKKEGGPTEESVVKLASSPDLLVLDDLGAGETSNAAIEQRLLYLVLEKRQNRSRSTVITTNLAPTELRDRVGQRLVGRLQPLEVMQFKHGRNFRRSSGKTAWDQ